MLIQFSVENFKSFKNEVVFSMESTKALKEDVKDRDFKGGTFNLLKTGVLYGSNASGKTNFYNAIKFMDWFVHTSSKESQSEDLIEYSPFLFSTETDTKPTTFEIVFNHNGNVYRYGFSFDAQKVHEEWLFYTPKKTEVLVFVREDQEFKLTSHFKSEQYLVAKKLIRPNALLLSVSAQLNGDMATKIMGWFSQFNCISGLSMDGYGGFTRHMCEDLKGSNEILNFLQSADMGISGLNLEENIVDMDSFPDHIRRAFKDKKGEVVSVNVKTEHLKYDKKGNVVGKVQLDMDRDESAGTQKFFNLSGPIIDTLTHGKVLVIDELDARLHPRLVKAVCDLFHSTKTNPKNAQLVFISHETSILNRSTFRRDQVWFVEKDEQGVSDLYSLADFINEDGTKVRNDASYDKKYLTGKLGAVPVLNEFEVPYGD